MLIGCGCHSDDLSKSGLGLRSLACLEIENYLFPGFADQAEQQLPAIQTALAGYPGRLLLSGPYIDLNPGTPDRRVREVVWSRYRQACDFAQNLGAQEIIFLSTFLPLIRLSFYEEDWIARSTTFWQELIAQVPMELTISFCNTFECNPDYLVQIVRAIGRENFRLAFDIGHYLVYGEISLEAWLERIAPYCTTVYVHSNNGQVDSHDPPYGGLLSRRQMHTVIRSLKKEATLIIKANDKSTLSRSVHWLEQAVEGDG